MPYWMKNRRERAEERSKNDEEEVGDERRDINIVFIIAL